MLLIVAAVGLLTAAVACSSEPTLVVYSGRSEALVGPIISQFEDASGIAVVVKYGTTGALAATLLEEGDKTPADVFFAQDPGGLGAVREMLAVLDEEILDLVPVWARSPEGHWVGISGRARTVVYNVDRLTEEDLPDTLEGFVEPEWRGRIGWAPTNASFQAMVTAMRLLWGEEETRAWVDGILANKPKVYPKNTPIVQAVADGEVDVGFVNHYYVHRFLAEQGESFPARNYYLRGGGPGSVVLVAGAGILETAKNTPHAEEFLIFMLGQVAQQYFADQTFEHPLVGGVETSPAIPPLEDLSRPVIDISDLGDVENTQALLRKAGALP